MGGGKSRLQILIISAGTSAVAGKKKMFVCFSVN